MSLGVWSWHVGSRSSDTEHCGLEMVLIGMVLVHHAFSITFFYLGNMGSGQSCGQYVKSLWSLSLFVHYLALVLQHRTGLQQHECYDATFGSRTQCNAIRVFFMKACMLSALFLE